MKQLPRMYGMLGHTTTTTKKMEGKQIKISSYNCAGFKGQSDFIKEKVYTNCDIVLLQETWLHNFEFNLFNQTLPECQYHAVSAMDESDVGSVGRPKGGCAIVWHKDRTLSIIPVVTISPRLCVVTIKAKNSNILLCNVYMPCDDNSNANYEEYGDTLYEMITLIESYKGHDIIIGGDFNVDFSRNNSRNLRILSQFINDEQLNCITLRCPRDTFTFENSRHNRSFIDHFIVSERLNNCIAYVYDEGDNLSDHKPITIETTLTTNLIPNKNVSRHIIEWDKASSEHKREYKDLLDSNFRNLTISENILNCNDFNCKQHEGYILQKLEESIDIFKFCANSTIPNKRLSGKGGIHGWNEFVKPYKDKSMHWHNVWKSVGRPTTGPVADRRKFSRSKYHWAVRKAKRDTEMLILNESAHQLASKSFREFWKTIKRLKGTKRVTSNVVDGICNDQGIADNFKNVYKDLLNSVNDNKFNKVINEVNKLVSDKCNNNNCSSSKCHVIDKDLLRKAIHSLKNGKDDEIYYLSSDHFIHASEIAIEKLSIILNLMLKHGIASESVNKSVIKPIPKCMQKSLSVSTNYRAISKLTIISKILDYIMILQIEDKLSTASYQFAYKQGYSTSMCSFLVAETIQYYKSHGSDVFMLSLDASKAFDRVKYTKLFKELINREICPLIIRFLMNIYICSSATVKWNTCESESFKIGNGVKQGGIISAPLFAIYIEPLLSKLNATKQGCYIGNICANAFAYADDIVILSPSCSALRQLILICEKFANDYNVRFNPDKCTLLIFSTSDFIKNNVNIILCGTKVRTVTDEKHLGHIFSSEYGQTFNLIKIDNVIRDMKVRTNIITTQFKPISWKSKTTVFNSQCLSLYGCQLWRLDDIKIEKLCTTWKVCCRRLLNLSQRTRSHLIHHLMGTATIRDIIMYRMLSFFIAGINHKDNIISFFYKNVLLSNTSYMSTNIRTIIEHFNINYLEMFSLNKSKLKNILNSMKGEKDWQSNIIEELLNMREDSLSANLNKEEIQIMLNETACGRF